LARPLTAPNCVLDRAGVRLAGLSSPGTPYAVEWPVGGFLIMTSSAERFGEIVDLHFDEPIGSAPQTSILVSGNRVVVIRLGLPAGGHGELGNPQGELTLMCAAGSLRLTSGGVTRELSAGQLVYAGPGEPCEALGVEAAVLIVTLIDPPPEASDLVQEASE